MAEEAGAWLLHLRAPGPWILDPGCESSWLFQMWQGVGAQMLEEGGGLLSLQVRFNFL